MHKSTFRPFSLFPELRCQPGCEMVVMQNSNLSTNQASHLAAECPHPNSYFFLNWSKIYKAILANMVTCAAACALAWYTRMTLYNSLSSKLHLKISGCWKYVREGNLAPIISCKSHFRKELCAHRHFLSFSFCPWSSDINTAVKKVWVRRALYSLLRCLSSSDLFHNYAYLEFWEQIQEHDEGFMFAQI